LLRSSSVADSSSEHIMSASPLAVPEYMLASVYRGESRVSVEQIPVPAIGPGELLVRVEACGVCHTDLKKIEYDLLPPPRVYGHETAGVVVAAGPDVCGFAPGDRVCLFHHIPCLECFYCRHHDYAQCPTYKQVGVTAGFEPAGGGFAQYVRVMDWVVRRGVVKLPDDVSFDRASFVEPVNTCLKALAKADVQPDETVLVMGQGPIGLLFTMLLRQRGVEGVYATDRIPARLETSRRLGTQQAWDAAEGSVSARMRSVTEGRGADVVVVAASAPSIVEQAVDASRPGARILLFAQTSIQESFQLAGASICVAERTLFGSYSASIDLQQQSAEIVWEKDFPVEDLVSHRLPLEQIEQGMRIARQPTNGSLKLIVHPQR
jgi:L-iditol 2-dehydrogenase